MGPWVCRLHGSNLYVVCVGYVGLNIFYVGQHFTWVIIFTLVSWVRVIFAWVKIFCVDQFLTWVNIFCVS